ncbi:nucleotide sugar dehydrogenase [Methanobrevibacter millerae]|uniref:UDP-N-acetyl-D-mannosamine dehydrogenase n=1 Tax=Methanobrevibacter millerae TaxID=230361 RepID=A0A1G5WV97_9EURY|nr:nucleotide sugar dehydrogenase [Methanobrevibacter millerae]SDA61834.1 UDP-N-acetyl-D-mannosaminuronic acid dehydrogenase [Methanobrevibacter millerae]
MKICVIGQGYIGLPTAALFALNECNVVGVDIKKEVIDDLNKGIVHIEEPGISEAINDAIKEKRYVAQLEPSEADVFIITVPTPYKMENLSCDLSFVIEACNSILKYVKKGNVIIVESTIAPGSIEETVQPIFENNGFEIGEDLFLAHCPERVLPGRIMYELINNDRIIGGVTPKCTEKAAEAYGIFVKGELMKTEAKTAELSKCMENTFRDINIALANELAKICAEIDVNALDVIKLANKHPRVNILNPGPGVGGHCLAIDPYFIYAKAPETAKIIKLARDTNKSMPNFVTKYVEKIIEKYDDENSKIAILGVSYKGNTGDTRESPAFEIISNLKQKGYGIAIFDPHVENEEYQDFENAINDASLCLILADHDEFKELDIDILIKQMKNPIIFDTKNIVKEVAQEEVILYNLGNLSKI